MNHLEKLAEAIKDIDYVVQRNWHNLPETMWVDGHGDLDLFTTNEAKERLRTIVDEIMPDPSLVDIRSAEDNYYPSRISEQLLIGKRNFRGFKIPSPSAYFLSLYYHNVIHKNDDPYKDELKRAFKDWQGVIKCRDNGVGYYIGDTANS